MNIVEVMGFFWTWEIVKREDFVSIYFLIGLLAAIISPLVSYTSMNMVISPTTFRHLPLYLLQIPHCSVTVLEHKPSISLNGSAKTSLHCNTVCTSHYCNIWCHFWFKVHSGRLYLVHPTTSWFLLQLVLLSYFLYRWCLRYVSLTLMSIASIKLKLFRWVRFVWWFLVPIRATRKIHFPVFFFL